MLRRIRRVVAMLFFTLLTLLFLDFTGTIHIWFGWLAKVQLVPAILAVNVGVIAGLVVLTLLFGRLYCSVICPLGVMQDGVSHLSARRKKKKHRFRYAKPLTWLRYGVLTLFVAALVGGVSVIASLLDPYAVYGRMATNLFAPLYRLGNNLLAFFAEKADSYMFYTTDVWLKSGISLGIAVAMLVVVAVLSWRRGRTYCHTICPVGTLLGVISRISIFRPAFNNKCVKCGACERNCKSSCIDARHMSIDRSRCVSCFNCIESCKFGAMTFTASRANNNPAKENTVVENSAENQPRRKFLSLIGFLALAKGVKAQQMHVDGGLAEIEEKKIPVRNTPIVPPGAQSLHNLNRHCTACQLCISACPHNVLRPSSKLTSLMQPEMSYERGYCRPECTECAQVCPAGAIKKISKADKAGLSIGQAVWIKENCVVNTDDIKCDSCERHCPTGAIMKIARDPADEKSLKIPVVDKEICIGCGACEHYCPARPFSAIYVEGNTRHHAI